MKRTVLMLATALATGAAAPEPASDLGVDVHVGSHDGFGRVVFDIPHTARFTVQRSGDTATVHFDGAGIVPDADHGTRNVTSVHGGNSIAVIALKPGVRLRTMRVGDRAVIDALDPVSAAKPAARDAPETAAAPAPAAPQPAASPVEPVMQAALPPPVPETPAPAPAPPAASSPPDPVPTEPLAIAATHVDLPPGVGGSAVLLPFAAQTGAAAFRRGGMAWIVFDERRPIDMAALRNDPVLGAAAVQLLTAASLVRLPLPDGTALRLTRQDDGWTVAALPEAAVLTPIVPVTQAGHLLLPAAAPGNVVVVPDPDTGQNLLVGTLRGQPAGIAVSYRMPELVIDPSWQGVLVEPLSDGVSLHASPDGFVLATGGVMTPAPAGAQALNLAASLTRRFDFPSDTPAALMRRLQAQVAQAGEAPPQARSKPRAASAQTMIALGMGAEAQSVLLLAAEEDPRFAADPDFQGLSAIAALLSGRDAEADGLDAGALTGTDEIALWRAVRAAQHQEGAPEAAAVFAVTFPMILSYPETLQGRILPLAAETMALGGAPEAADALLALRPNDPGLAYARALRLQARGEMAAALAAYDALAAARDRLASTRAATRAALLRLETGELTPSAAAASLEGQFLAWRGDNRELDLRLRVAALRVQSGAWRPALDLLRETAVLYPDAADLINGRRAELLTKLLVGSAAADLPAIDLISLAEENAELVAAIAPAQIASLLADKLVSLDLPRRAAPVLDRMMRAAAPGQPRAILGARLAAVRFRAGDDAGAAAAIDASAASDLPPPLLEERVLLSARITAHAGNPGAAAATLAALDSAPAADLRATLLTDAHEWRSAQLAMQDLADKTVPATGPIDPAQQDTLLRLATAQQRAGDTAALYALGQLVASRMTGPRADMFRLLTAAPVDGVGDLRRASSEIALARSIPTSLAAIGSR